MLTTLPRHRRRFLTPPPLTAFVEPRPRLGALPHKTQSAQRRHHNNFLVYFAQRLCIGYSGFHTIPARHLPPWGRRYMTQQAHLLPRRSYHADLRGAPHWLLPTHGSLEDQLVFQRNSVRYLQRLLGAHQPVAYYTPSGDCIDCFISDCYNIPWPLPRLYLLGCIPLCLDCGNSPIHPISVLERINRHNQQQ